MGKKLLYVLGMVNALSLALQGAEAFDKKGREIFRSKCQLCHVTHSVTPAERAKLLGPPIGDVMLRIKERYPIREDAVAFIVDYSLHPSIDKALCPSLDTYGLMPSMVKKLSKEEAKRVAQMLVDTFPVRDPSAGDGENLSTPGNGRGSSL
jgi:hypothetical protein